jgi:Flp pilus assembly protein CpaB
MIFSRFKISALAIVAAVAGVFGVIARLLWSQNGRLVRRVENAEEKARRAVIIAEADRDIETAKRKLRNEIKNTGTDGTFRDPNSLWTKSDDS